MRCCVAKAAEKAAKLSANAHFSRFASHNQTSRGYVDETLEDALSLQRSGPSPPGTIREGRDLIGNFAGCGEDLVRRAVRYRFSEIPIEARVVSQSRRIVQALPAWSNAMVKSSTGEGSFETFMSTRANS